jgi:hypothetical protein
VDVVQPDFEDRSRQFDPFLAHQAQVGMSRSDFDGRSRQFDPFRGHQAAHRGSAKEQGTLSLAVPQKETPPALHQVKETAQLQPAVRGNTPPPAKKGMTESKHGFQTTTVRGNHSPTPGRSSLLAATRRIIGQGLDRLQNPQPEGLLTRGLLVVRQPASLGILPLLTLTNAFGLLVVSCSYYFSVLGYGNNVLEVFFYTGLLLMFVPNLVRLLSPAPSRLERICLLCVLGISFYLVQFMASPLRFSEFDEFLSWRTAGDILRTGHLFSANSMLPVGPFYPGLQIVTNEISTLSGLDSFHAAIIVISAARLLMILAFFLFCEQLTGSSRMAGIATLIYMTNVHFLFFDALFNYETLALPLAIFMFYILVRFENTHKGSRWMIYTAWIVLAAVIITHHMTSYAFDGMLVLWAIVALFRPVARSTRLRLAAIACCGVLLSLAYALLLPRNPVMSYLSNYFGNAFNEIGHILAGTSTTRPLFVSAGHTPPLWDKLLMAASVGIITLCLPFGLLSLQRQHRHNALAVMLGIFSLVYPLAQAFRFTDFGTEIADRSAAFVLLAIAYALTILITHFWPARKLSRKAVALIVGTLAVVFLGGVLLDSGASWQSLPGPYLVGADQRSIEPDGIQAAQWASVYLGANNRVGADRTNQMLMDTYGDQDIVTHLAYTIDITPVFFSGQFDSEDLSLLRQARVRYLVVDLRLSTSVPLLGYYYEVDEPGAFHHTSPISRTALTKFNSVPQINRVFDNGNIVIFDTGAFLNESG